MSVSNRERVIDALRRAADFCEAPDHALKTHGWMACDNDGEYVEPNDPRACQWCATGRVAHLLGVSRAMAVAIWREHEIADSMGAVEQAFDGGCYIDAGYYLRAIAHRLEQT